MKYLRHRQFDQERACYQLRNTTISDCVFSGPEDGESPLKHPVNVRLIRTHFSLRYPIWHALNFEIDDCDFDEKARAAIWYCYDGKILRSRLFGVKALRDCENILLEDCDIDSAEFGWKSRGAEMRNCRINAEYIFLDAKDARLKNCRQSGKYSFQYCRDIVIEDCELDTKDAFWHSTDVTVRNSRLKGEYLGWYSVNLTLDHCVIEGTQPLCFCKGLKLIGCRMEHTDLAFEASDVNATVSGRIESVKNPRAGRIQADGIDEIIMDDPAACGIILIN